MLRLRMLSRSIRELDTRHFEQMHEKFELESFGHLEGLVDIG
jgi:hypothetical protein